MSVFVIAEAGVNHNGDIELAHRLIDKAYECGADAVKFQTFDAKKLEAPGPRRDMLKALEFTINQFAELKDYCADRIEFMSTPFDAASLWALSGMGVKRLKISSGGLFDVDLLRAAEESRLPIILSTGMATPEDISEALRHLKYDDDITLLHCTSAYPCPVEDVNLKAMVSLKSFGCPVGLSSHSISTVIPSAAVALGASVIEMHLTLDRTMPGPDHASSLEPFDFKKMVSGVREIEKALGDGVKRQMPSEAGTVKVMKDRRAWAA